MSVSPGVAGAGITAEGARGKWSLSVPCGMARASVVSSGTWKSAEPLSEGKMRYHLSVLVGAMFLGLVLLPSAGRAQDARDPSYKGKTLSGWIKDLENGNPSERE